MNTSAAVKISPVQTSSTSFPPSDEQAKNQKPYAWILHPAIDLLFCCGGLVWIFFAYQYFFFEDLALVRHAEGFAALLIILGHLFSDPHTAATLVRVYRNETNRKRYHFVSTWGAAMCAGILLLGLLVDGLPPYLLKAYVVLVIHHYMSQSYGIALLYCFKRGVFLSGWQKRIIWLLAMSTSAYAIIREFTFPIWGGRQFLYYQLPFIGPLPVVFFEIAEMALGLSMLSFAGLIIYMALKEKRLFPLPSILIMFTGVFIFLADGPTSAALWMFVPAVYHGSQYLVVAAAYHLKESGLPSGLSTHQIAQALSHSRAIQYAGTVVAGGICIYIGVPYIISEFGVAYIVAFTCVFSAFNFHHFLTDREIWRLRDPETRRLLLA